MTTAVQYSVDEYLEMENQAAFRSEYVEGVIFPMPGVSPNHSLILSALMGYLFSQMKGRGQLHAQELRLKITGADAYFYPDVAIVLGKSEYDRHKGYHLLNPTVIIEVLSPGTAMNGRQDKFTQYQRIPSLQEYILVAQERPSIEQYCRDGDGVWQLQATIYEQMDEILQLDSIGCTLALADIYADVDFEAEYYD